jgi:serine protease
VLSATSITAVAPAHAAGAVDVTVTGPGGTATKTNGYRYVASLTSLTPTTGPAAGGTSVTITGIGLTGATSVRFGSATATNVVVIDDTQVTATSPSGAGTVSVSVVVGGGTVSLPSAFTYTSLAPTEPDFLAGNQWGLTGTYGVKATGAWDYTTGSSSVVVAVIDTGSTTHPDLEGQTVAGYDMISDVTVAGDGNGRDADPSDTGDWYGSDNSSWHGTHVAGIINAAANGFGVVGVAPGVKVQHVRALGHGGGFMSDVASAIIWASGGTVAGLPVNTAPVEVINMSLGGAEACSTTTQDAINVARANGVTVVVAAGNSSADASGFDPAGCTGVITVAATTDAGKRASFSNYGSLVEIAAPGYHILSTLNAGTTVPASPSYQYYSGTSMATPFVAGIVALMKSKNPLLTPDQVLAKIQTAGNYTAFAGGVCDPSVTCGSGIINAAAVVAAS